jgi:16S rRNA (guanine527-N7)-methyltransferase
MTPFKALARRFGLQVETVARLKAFDDVFIARAEQVNLVSRASLPERWERHYADSLQLLPLIPEEADVIVDIGSGAGFPAIPLACAMQYERAPQFNLVESVGKKALFLTEAAAAIPLSNVQVHNIRAEAFHVKHAADVVMARAVASLEVLLDLAVPLSKPDGLLIFPKGESVQNELTEASKTWRFQVESVPSQTRRGAEILLIHRAEPK